jgi:hypothetical protein
VELDLACHETFAGALAVLAPDDASSAYEFIVSPDGSGSVLGVGLGTFLQYTDLPAALPRLLDSHFFHSSGREDGGAAAWLVSAHTWDASLYKTSNRTALAEAALRHAAALVADPAEAAALAGPALHLFLNAFGGQPGFTWPAHLGPSAIVAMASQTLQYSKARGTAGDLSAARANATNRAAPPHASKSREGRLKKTGPRLPFANVDGSGRYVTDHGVKHGAAWPALVAAGERYMAPLHASLSAFSGRPPPSPCVHNGGFVCDPRGVLVSAEAVALLGGRMAIILRGTPVRGGPDVTTPGPPAAASATARPPIPIVVQHVVQLGRRLAEEEAPSGLGVIVLAAAANAALLAVVVRTWRGGRGREAALPRVSR